MKSALALTVVLVAKDSTLAKSIASQSMWAEVPCTTHVTSFNWLFLGYRSPHKPVDVVNRLDVRTDQSHLAFPEVALIAQGIDNRQPLCSRDFIKNCVRRDKVVDQMCSLQFECYGKLQRIQSTKLHVEGVTLHQGFGQGKR